MTPSEVRSLRVGSVFKSTVTSWRYMIIRKHQSGGRKTFWLVPSKIPGQSMEEIFANLPTTHRPVMKVSLRDLIRTRNSMILVAR